MIWTSEYTRQESLDASTLVSNDEDKGVPGLLCKSIQYAFLQTILSYKRHLPIASLTLIYYMSFKYSARR